MRTSRASKLLLWAQKDPDINKGLVQMSIHFDHTQQRHIVLLPGSNQIMDWIRINFRVTHKHGYHSGFYRYAERVIKILNDEIDHKSDMIIVGHSMGAAAATIVADILEAPAITFACPRFERVTKNRPNVRSYRFKDDPISVVPPRCFGYETTKHETWGDNKPGKRFRKHSLTEYHYEAQTIDLKDINGQILY